MKNKAEVVIIGGGVNGCGLAYTLAKNGFTDVMVLEKKYLCSGETGRCGGGIRQQWSTAENIQLAMGSVRIFETLSEELNYDIEYKQGGYLIPAFTEEEIINFKKNISLQNSLGVGSYFLKPEEILKIVPYLNIENVLGAAFCPTDGYANPIRVVEGYAINAKKLGVEIYDHTEVTYLKVENKSIKKVVTNHGAVDAKIVVNAAGAYSRVIAKMAGVNVPNQPYRHEILVTEPLEEFLKPMVISFHHGIYFRQTSEGNIIGGIGDPNEPSSYNILSSLEFLQRMAKTITEFMPILKGVRILRQWAGLYDVTPDARPILGYVDEVDNFIQMHGFSGHGFMVSPMVTKEIANLIMTGKTSRLLESLSLKRFREGRIEKEFAVVG